MAKVNFAKNEYDRVDYKALIIEVYMLARDFVGYERECRPCTHQMQEDGGISETTQIDIERMLELFKNTAVSLNELNTKVQNMIKSAGL